MSVVESSIVRHEGAPLLPSRLPDPGPEHVPFTRLVRVESRKLIDTRAGRWLLAGGVAISAIILAVLLVQDRGEHPFNDYLQATTMPLAILLPVLGVMAVTTEWSQRTALVTFALEPRRLRVGFAKLVAALILGCLVTLASFTLAAAVHQFAITALGATGDWTLPGLTALGATLFVITGLLQGFALGMLLRNTPAAIVLYFAIPTAWGFGSAFSFVNRIGGWLDVQRTLQPLVESGLPTGEEWLRLAVAVSVSIALPTIIGFWRLTRTEVK